MNYKHLFWIIPLCIIIGILLWSALISVTNQQLTNLLIDCMSNSNWLK